jgi:hypothetical protein
LTSFFNLKRDVIFLSFRSAQFSHEEGGRVGGVTCRDRLPKVCKC